MSEWVLVIWLLVGGVSETTMPADAKPIGRFPTREACQRLARYSFGTMMKLDNEPSMGWIGWACVEEPGKPH